MAARKNGFHLRMTDMSDREVLGLVEDQADEDGWTEAAAVATALWPRIYNGSANAESQVKAARAVASRLAWMRRYGIVDREEKSRRWALTREGEHLLNGKLSGAQASAIKSLKGSTLVLAIHEVTERPADEMLATLMRRAWRYGTVAR